MKSKNRPEIAALFGIGLDNTDGHKRITQAEQFAVIGGSEQTHERMTETLLKTMEDVRKSGKTLGEMEPQAISEIIHKNTPR